MNPSLSNRDLKFADFRVRKTAPKSLNWPSEKSKKLERLSYLIGLRLYNLDTSTASGTIQALF